MQSHLKGKGDSIVLLLMVRFNFIWFLRDQKILPVQERKAIFKLAYCSH